MRKATSLPHGAAICGLPRYEMFFHTISQTARLKKKQVIQIKLCLDILCTFIWEYFVLDFPYILREKILVFRFSLHIYLKTFLCLDFFLQLYLKKFLRLDFL